MWTPTRQGPLFSVRGMGRRGAGPTKGPQGSRVCGMRLRSCNGQVGDMSCLHGQEQVRKGKRTLGVYP